MNLLKLSWKNLLYKPLSLLLTLILFGLGVGLISLILLIDKQLQDNFENNLAGIDLVVGAKGSPLQLILSSMYHIDAPTGNIKLGDAKPFLNPAHPLISESIPLSLGDSHREFRIVGTNPEFVDLYNASVAQGKLWEYNYEATIGALVAKNLNFQLGDHFKSSHGLTDENDLGHEEAEEFEIVGILQPTGSVIDQLILTTTQSFWMVHGQHAESDGDAEFDDHHSEEHEHEGDHEGELKSKPKPLIEENNDQDITSILIKFRGRNYQALNMQRNINQNTELQAATPAIEINRLFNLMNTGEQALRALAFIITFVSGLSIFISLFSSLKDRQYELALMRVMGSTPSKLFLMIILEGLLISLSGFLMGMLLSHGGMYAFSHMMESSYRYSFSAWEFLDKEIYLLFGSLAIGLIAAIIPAAKASKTDIAQILTQ